MVQNRAVDEAFNVTEAIRNAADAAIPKKSIPPSAPLGASPSLDVKPAPTDYTTDEEDIITYDVEEDELEHCSVLILFKNAEIALAPINPTITHSPRKLCKPWWNTSCQQAKKERRRAWGIFRRYPTTDNLIAFKRAKALARRIRRQCQRESWIQYVSSITSSTTSNSYGERSKQRMAFIENFNIPILETSTALYSSPLDVANLIGKTFASVSSSDSYSPAFQATKNRLERTPINFRCRQPFTI
ncbi:putative RNA-directed DNA polymerase from transposon X-element [Trichonephila clavipes]|nr:putative RNA-directed DNA polymerase from transposon X-element [Trichonephila clavipes]